MARHAKDSTPKLTDALIAELVSVIRGGCYIETAAAICGISKQTFYRWLKDAQDDEASDILIKLSDAVRRAAAESEARDIAVIDKAAQDGMWQAAAWRLERKHSERWGRQSKVQLEHSGVDGRPIEVVDTHENVKLILRDVEALTALETLEAKLGSSEDDKGR